MNLSPATRWAIGEIRTTARLRWLILASDVRDTWNWVRTGRGPGQWMPPPRSVYGWTDR